MTIDEAIFELDEGLRQLRGYLNKDYSDAIDLGSEALKHVKAVRALSGSENPPLLPGETEG